MSTYEVTCAFDGPVSPTPGIAIDRILDTITEMHAEGVEIYHRDTTLSTNGDESNRLMISRFTAPTEGIVGWHVFRARLPVCGITRIGDTQGTTGGDSEDRSHTEST